MPRQADIQEIEVSAEIKSLMVPPIGLSPGKAEAGSTSMTRRVVSARLALSRTQPPTNSRGPGRCYGRAMRIETVVNSPRDLGCLARLPNLAELQGKARACNARILEAERADQGTGLASPAFECADFVDDFARYDAVRAYVRQYSV